MKKFNLIIMLQLFFSGCENLDESIKRSAYEQTPQAERGDYYYKSYEEFNSDEEKKRQDYNLIWDKTPVENN